MPKPTLEMARAVARLIPMNISYNAAFSACQARHPRMSAFDLSVMAGWVEKYNKQDSQKEDEQ